MRERPEKPIFGPETPRFDPPNPPEITAWRSAAKAVSWRTVGTLDTLILSYLLITYVGPLFGSGLPHGQALESASYIALTEFVTKMALYFLHERAWDAQKWGIEAARGGAIESYRRTSVKTATWRAIASLDTVLLSWLYTGSIATAVSIGSVEIFTKMTLYFIHERIWTRIPFGIVRDAGPANRS